MGVVSSTVFQVKPRLGDEFIRRWRGLALSFVQQPEFICVHPFRSLGRRGHFLPIAEWASQAEFSSPDAAARHRALPSLDGVDVG